MHKLTKSQSECDKKVNSQTNRDTTTPDSGTMPHNTTPPPVSLPMDRSTPPSTGMPTNRGSSPGTTMPRNGTTPPSTGMPMNGTMPPSSTMPRTGTTPPSTGMPMNGTMPPSSTMPRTGTTPPATGMPRGSMPMNGTPMNGMPMNGMPMNGMPMNGMPMNTPYNTPMGVPLYPLYGYDNCEDLEKDMDYFQQLYPSSARRIQNEINNECDKLEYDGSVMFDEYPDRETLNRIIDRVFDKVKDMDETPSVESNSIYFAPRRRRGLLRDFISIILLNELVNRRRRRRSRRRWF